MPKVFHICQEINGRIEPVNGACDNFDYQHGCLGHDQTGEDEYTCPGCGDVWFTYVDQYANGECWKCESCGREVIFSEK